MNYTNTYNSSYQIVPNKTLRNTMTLLALTTGFSGLMAYVNMQMQIFINPLIAIGVYFGLLFLLNAVKNNGGAIIVAFAITGWLGFMLGPIVSAYMNVPGGSAIVMNAFLGTALTFAGTSLYAYKKRPTIKGVWMSNLFWISLVGLGLSLLNYYFFNMPALSILISVVFLAISSLYLTFSMSQIFQNDPNINYVLATVGIFASLYNIFVSLLNILGFARN